MASPLAPAANTDTSLLPWSATHIGAGVIDRHPGGHVKPGVGPTDGPQRRDVAVRVGAELEHAAAELVGDDDRRAGALTRPRRAR